MLGARPGFCRSHLASSRKPGFRLDVSFVEQVGGRDVPSAEANLPMEIRA